MFYYFSANQISDETIEGGVMLNKESEKTFPLHTLTAGAFQDIMRSHLHVKASERSFVTLQRKGDHVGALIFNTCVSSQEFEGAEIFGVVEGGDILEERLRSARETAKKPVGGFCLDGFQAGCMDQALRTQLINAVTKELPEDKPRSALSKHTLVGE